MSQRITSNIIPWHGKRQWRAEIYVDGYRVAKEFFNSHSDAAAWCEAEKARLAQEVRG